MSNIVCENISLKVNSKQNEYILKNINLEIYEHDFVAILGKSGSGKTTLLNIMVGLLKPTQGKMLIDGLDITRISEKKKTYWRRYDVGYVFQNYGLVNVLNVYDNIKLVLDLESLTSLSAKYLGYQRKIRQNVHEQIEYIMKRLNIWALRDKFPHELSGGQQQRLSIARTMVKQPKYIFCDEPTGALDHATSLEVMNLLLELNMNGSTVIMITHNELLIEYTNRVVNISDGKILNTWKNNNTLMKKEIIHLQYLYTKQALLWSLQYWYQPQHYFVFQQLKKQRRIHW